MKLGDLDLAWDKLLLVLDETYNNEEYAIDRVLKCVDALRELPTVEQEWIPCSERLPNEKECLKDDGNFLICLKNNRGQLTRRFDGTSFEAEVIAWQPLPKPYQPKEVQE